MNKRGWLIPILIITLNVLAIILRWGSLSEILPAHFDLDGNAGGTMPRTTLLFYPLIGAVVCLIGYFIARAKGKLGTGMIILTSGIALILFFSTLVTLTSGQYPAFMIAEPIILLTAVVSSIIGIVRSR